MTLFESALRFAVAAHDGQTRKNGRMPYILHPAEVAVIASTMTSDEEVLAAAVLHDTVEDAGVTLQELREMFGDRVARLVELETENKRWDLPAGETWMIRKQESLEHLASARDRDAQIVWLSDKLANLRSFLRMYRQEGDAFWQRFNQKDPEKQRWYYERVASLVGDLSGEEAYREYMELLRELFPEDKGEGTHHDD